MKLSPNLKIALIAFIAGNITMYLYMKTSLIKPYAEEVKRLENKKEQFKREFKKREREFMFNSEKFNEEWKRISEEQKKRMDENDKARKEWDRKFDQTRDEIIQSIKDNTYFKKGGFQAFSKKHEELMKSGKEAIEKGSERVRQDTQKEVDHIEDKIDQVSQTPFVETMSGHKILISPRKNKDQAHDESRSPSELNQTSEKEE